MNEKILMKTDKNGTKYYHIRCSCAKCGGTGMIDYYRPVNGGVCFDCDGSGINEYDMKEYTPEYEAKLAEQRKKRAEKKLAEERKHAAEKNAKFFEMNGFTPEGKTYFVLGNTYDIKEQLKAQGAKWDNLSRHWHMPTQPEGLETFEVSVDEMYYADAAGVYDWRNWMGFHEAEEDNMTHYAYKIEEAENNKKVRESTSKHVGQVGDKITLNVIYVHTASWENAYGGWLNHSSVTNLHAFKDDEGNVYVWKTANYIEAEYGDTLIIQGTVKDHSEYNGIPQTVLTRCKVTAVKEVKS